MPPPERSGRWQKAVLLVAVGRDTTGDLIVSGTPQVLDVKWNSTFRETRGPQGNTVTITAEVIVDRDIPTDSIMWLGDATSIPRGTAVSDWSGLTLMQVVGSNNVPDIKGRVYAKSVSLARYRSAPPIMT